MRYFGNNIKVVLDNLIVSYTDYGPDDSPVLIFIHGFPLNKTMWNPQIDSLKDNYRVITYDIRGHGDSDIGEKALSIDLFVTDLISLMDKLNIDKAAICGLSMGGYIALNAILKFPERFEALVLCDTTCISDSPETKEKRGKAIESIKKDGVEKYSGESVKNLFAPESLITKRAEVDLVKQMIVNTSENSLCSTLVALAARQETCSNLNEIRVPVLILVGEEDKIAPPDAARNMDKGIKNSRLHIIGHAGHLSNFEQPEEFNNELVKFFETIYKKPESSGTDANNSILSQVRNRLNMLLTFRTI